MGCLTCVVYLVFSWVGGYYVAGFRVLVIGWCGWFLSFGFGWFGLIAFGWLHCFEC